MKQVVADDFIYLSIILIDACFLTGGAISLLALNGLFILIHQHNL